MAPSPAPFHPPVVLPLSARLHAAILQQLNALNDAALFQATFAKLHAITDKNTKSLMGLLADYRQEKFQLLNQIARDLTKRKSISLRVAVGMAQHIVADSSGHAADMNTLSPDLVKRLTAMQAQRQQLETQYRAVFSELQQNETESHAWAVALIDVTLPPSPRLLLSRDAEAKKVEAATTGQSLFNDIGTGNPRLNMQLSTNGPQWNSYTIDYQQEGGVPYSTNTSSQWSSWNIIDDQGNYYGTINLMSDGQSVWEGNPVYIPPNPANGYAIAGFSLSKTTNGSAYQATVSAVTATPSQGPFPNTPPATPATYYGTQEPIALSVQGNQIVDNKGRKVQIKGVHIPSLEWNPQGQYLSPGMFKQIAASGANHVRISINQAFWFASEDESVIGSYRQIINAMIACATTEGLAVSIDLHWLNSSVGQGSMPDADTPELWRQIATVYKDFGTVMFELFNEPNNMSPELWLNTFQPIVDVIQKDVGAMNLLLLAGYSQYAYQWNGITDETAMVQGENIICVCHAYNDQGNTDFPASLGGGFDTNLAGVKSMGRALAFTEMGDNTAGDYNDDAYAQVVTEKLQWIEQQVAQGWLISYDAFAWWGDTSNPAFPIIINENGQAAYSGLLYQQDVQKYPPTYFFNPPTAVADQGLFAEKGQGQEPGPSTSPSQTMNA